MRYKKEGVGAGSTYANIWIRNVSHARRVTIFRTPASIASDLLDAWYRLPSVMELTVSPL